MYKIIINKTEEKKDILILENGELVEQYEEREDINRIEGNIYIGKPRDIIKGMQAAFIDIGEKHNAFIHFKDTINGEVNIKEPILVQVKKAATLRKGAKLTSNISLTGRYIVLMPYVDFITISQKIEEGDERERLTKITKSLIPENYGAIIRTSAYSKSEQEIEKDIKNLINKWETIKSTEIDTVPKLVYESDNLTNRILKDLVDQGIETIITNDKEIYKELKSVVSKFEEEIKIETKENILQILKLETKLSKLQERKIWLDSGAFITIDKTEALVAIDVNSGKYLGDNNLEKTSYEVNAEATIEIAKQLRLRDIGGIIVIDYIDMHDDRNKQKIIELLKKCCKKDRTKTQIEGFTKLNLLEMTRKHM